MAGCSGYDYQMIGLRSILLIIQIKEVLNESISCNWRLCRVPSGQFKKNTIRNHKYVLARFREQFGERELDSITSDEILVFLTQMTEGKKQTTRRVRYSLLKAFINFIQNKMPSERFRGNDAYLQYVIMSHNLFQWFKKISLPAMATP